MDISVRLTSSPKPKPSIDELGFGKYFSDHMFVMDYADGVWLDPRIVPYGPIEMDPASMVLHYGQSSFEGMKAYRAKDGRVLLFCPHKNMLRLNLSNDRLAIPKIDEDFVIEAVKQLIRLEHEWIPDAEDASIYIRPLIIATDPFLGVRQSDTYKFIIICSPSGFYYKGGLEPVKIYVEDEYVRAVRGGIGFAKTAGNYAAGLKSQVRAQEKGFSQVLWLDGIERKYVEEVGAMNVFFKIGDQVITPRLNGSILDGVTRTAVIELLKSWNVDVRERELSIDEVMTVHKENKLEEVFGTGTAAVISAVGQMAYKGEKIVINGGKIGQLTLKIYQTLTSIQKGELADDFGWVVTV